MGLFGYDQTASFAHWLLLDVKVMPTCPYSEQRMGPGPEKIRFIGASAVLLLCTKSIGVGAMFQYILTVGAHVCDVGPLA